MIFCETQINKPKKREKEDIFRTIFLYKFFVKKYVQKVRFFAYKNTKKALSSDKKA